MIQRIQSLLLLGVAVCMTLVLVFPIWEAELSGIAGIAGTGIEMDAFSIEVINKQGLPVPEQSTSVVYIGIVATLAAITALYEIFQFRNRKRQVRLGGLNNLLMVLLIGAIFLGIYTAEGRYNLEEDNYLFGFYLPLLAIILNLIATRQIKKDESLVRSAERLR